MTHGKQKPLVPITREFLRQFYQKYPLAPVPHEAKIAHLQRIEALAAEVTKPGSKVPEQVGMPSPTRIDDCFWRNRMICEELALSFSKLQEGLASQPELAATCARCHDQLVSAERSILAVQEHNTASVKAQLQQFIPQDFRGALLERQRVSTEARYKKQVDDLVKRGGSIRQKYDLYLQQQWERRQSLVQLGECSGMYKMVIKWVAGIPQVLLDFAKEINAKLGPMEEQRIKYGPDLYGITELGIRLNVSLAAWAESSSLSSAAAVAAAPRMAEVVEPAVGFYCEQMLRVIQHIGNVFQHSPFFVKKDDLDLGSGGGGGGEREEGAAAAAQKQVAADMECGSSNLSAASASGDYGAAVVVAAPAAKAPRASSAASAAAASSPPLLPQLSLAPSVQAPPTPGVPLEAPPPRSVALLSPAASGAAYPDKQQLLPRFDAKADGPAGAAAAPAIIAAAGPVNAVTAVCGGAASAAPLHRVPTPPPHAMEAAALAAGGFCTTSAAAAASRTTPQSGSRMRLTLSVDSHASWLSALDHQPWFIPEEDEAAAVAGERHSQRHSTQHQQHNHNQQQQQQQQQRSLGQGQMQAQPQGQGQTVAFGAGPEAEAVKDKGRMRAEVVEVVRGAGGPPGAREPHSPGCFSGCLGGRRRKSSGGGAGKPQQR